MHLVFKMNKKTTNLIDIEKIIYKTIRIIYKTINCCESDVNQYTIHQSLVATTPRPTTTATTAPATTATTTAATTTTAPQSKQNTRTIH